MYSKSVPFKCQFKEKEKVLCYEPDAEKTLVLYDSQILKVVQEIDKQGHKFCKYLIHFQGWNHSWDQYVTDDLLLKDTEENRKLKQMLAEKAHLTLGGDFDRKEREMSTKLVPKPVGKKSVKNQVNDKRVVKDRSEDLKLTKNQVDDDKRVVEDRSEDLKLTKNQVDDDKSVVEDLSEDLKLTKNQVDDDKPVVEDSIEDKIKINDAIELPVRQLPDLDFPNILKHHTGYNCHLVQDKKILVRLPCQPNVVTVLENFLKYMARNDFRFNKIIENKNNHEPEVINENQLRNRFTICVEVLDGLRICFNKYLYYRLLINKSEQIQYKMALKIMLQRPLTIIQHNKRKNSNTQCEEKLKNHDNGVKGKQENKYRRSARQYFKSQKSLTKLQISQMVREKYISKADSWKAVPDSAYNDEIKQPAIVYGVHHLLRLLEELPEILAPTELHGDKLLTVYTYINELLNYLSTQTHLFGPQYYLIAK